MRIEKPGSRITKAKWFGVVWLYNFVRAAFSRNKSTNESQPRKTAASEFVEGQYTDLKTILNDLSTTFNFMEKLKPQRHQTQKIIQKYGPFVIAGNWQVGLSLSSLEGFKAYGFPSLLIPFFPYGSSITKNSKGQVECFDAEINKLSGIGCCVKNKSFPVWLKRKHCAYYEVARVFLVDGKPREFYFCVEVNEKTGAVNALPRPTHKQSVIPIKNRRAHRGTKRHIINTTSMEYPQIGDEAEGKTSQKDRKAYMERFFIGCYNMTMLREYMVNIIVIKDGKRLTFGVPQNSWKSFFKHRIKIKTRSGKTKPIFHAVVSHKRKTKTKETYVKTHYRGLRHFEWQGYTVAIVMPGKHGAAQAGFNLSAYQGSSDHKGLSITGRVADKINSTFDAGAM